MSLASTYAHRVRESNAHDSANRGREVVTRHHSPAERRVHDDGLFAFHSFSFHSNYKPTQSVD
jgi:hypothetical protein